MALNLIFQEEARAEQAYTVGLLGGGRTASPGERCTKTDQGWVRGKRAVGRLGPAPAALPLKPLASRFADRVPASWGVAWELFT